MRAEIIAKSTTINVPPAFTLPKDKASSPPDALPPTKSYLKGVCDEVLVLALCFSYEYGKGQPRAESSYEYSSTRPMPPPRGSAIS